MASSTLLILWILAAVAVNSEMMDDYEVEVVDDDEEEDNNNNNNNNSNNHNHNNHSNDMDYDSKKSQEVTEEDFEVVWPKTFEDCYNDTLWDKMDFSSLDPEIYGYDIYHYSVAQNCSNYLRKKPDYWFILGLCSLFVFFAGFLLTFSFRFKGNYKRRRNTVSINDIIEQSLSCPTTSPPSYIFHRCYMRKEDLPNTSGSPTEATTAGEDAAEDMNRLPSYEEAVVISRQLEEEIV